MGINKSPRRIDRKAGGRNKKVIIKNYPKNNYGKRKNSLKSNSPTIRNFKVT